MSKPYSETFKKRAIQKALTRGNGVSMDQISNDIGVASGTLYHWIGKSRKTNITNGDTPEKRPQDWNAAEKLQAIIEVGPMNEENINSYCRQNGIYKHHIEQWKADMASTKTTSNKAENKALRLENKQLKKELRRKEKAMSAGARQAKICDALGVCLRTWQRWKNAGSIEDMRIYNNYAPANKLSEFEIQRILKITNEPRFANLPPKKIVPMLADEGIYIASESSFYRILKAANQLKHRNKSRAARKIIKPMELVATAPNQVYSWEGLTLLGILRTCQLMFGVYFCTCIW